MNEFQKAQNAKILSCYNTDEALSELQKAEILDIEKGGKRALIGEKRTFGGREYIKTSDGWKFHGKGTGTRAQEHAAGTATKTEKPEEKKEQSVSTAERKWNNLSPKEKATLRSQITNNAYSNSEYHVEFKDLSESFQGEVEDYFKSFKPTESPKAEESKLQGKVGEKITISGYYESSIEATVTKSTPTNIHIEFSNGDGLTIPKEHYLKGVTDHGYKKDAVTITPSSEAESTDSHSAAEIKKKALEIMRAKGNVDVKLSDFTIRQAKQVIKEHEALGSKETPKTEKVAEEKKDESIIGYTKSGKSVRDDHKHPSHDNFTSEENKEAADLHHLESKKEGADKWKHLNSAQVHYSRSRNPDWKD